MNFENFSSIAATTGGGFFGGIILGYALKKVIKILAIIVGLFLAGLAYLQSQQIASINWEKLQQVTDGAITIIANAAATTSIDDNGFIALTNFGISLTGSMSAGFTIGFIKG